MSHSTFFTRFTFLLAMMSGIIAPAIAMRATAIFPAKNATGVCVDTPLKITFDAPPSVGLSGTVKISKSDGTVVDTIDLALSSPKGTQTRLIGGTTYNTYPILVSGNTAIIQPKTGVFKYNSTYHITADTGVFAGVAGPVEWSFTTKANSPLVGSSTFTVDADGNGDFCSIQGVVDFLPENNTIPRLIDIRNGVYQEIVRVNSKHHLTFRGEDRKHTVVSYPNNNNLNEGSNTRAMFNIVADDITFRNLTLSNSTPKGGSQAEALRINGKRCEIRNCDLHTYQDTFLIQGESDTAYIVDSLIEGDVDFIWGYGRVVFDRCEIKSLSSGYICQMRNPAGQCGAVFLDCKLTRAAGVDKVFLARIDPNRFPQSAVAFVNCAMDAHIVVAGWLLNNGVSAPSVRFEEYESIDSSGAPLDISGRAAFSNQITAAEAAALRDLSKTLGGWSPAMD